MSPKRSSGPHTRCYDHIMEDDLKRKIAEDLRKAGRTSEMLAIDAFHRHQWSCEGSVGFHDRDEDIGREIDLHAHHGLLTVRAVGSATFTLRVIGEVKKSEKPWVALREHSLEKSELVDAWTNLTCGINLPDDRVALEPHLSRHSLLQSQGWRARGIHESFKHPNTSEASHSAFISVCKAAESALAAEEALLGESRRLADTTFLTLIKPVVILDGLLASATLAADGSIEVAPIDGAALRFQFRTARYTRETYNVDIVTLSYLDQYLDLAQQRIQSVADALADLSVDKRGER
jgi:hypothetical protein